jgi:hypothetical protein
MNERTAITVPVCERLQLTGIVRVAGHVIGADRQGDLAQHDARYFSCEFPALTLAALRAQVRRFG